MVAGALLIRIQGPRAKSEQIYTFLLIISRSKSERQNVIEFVIVQIRMKKLFLQKK
jgi:hypothetical protein